MEIGNWIASALTAPTDGSYGGYYIGYDDATTSKIIDPGKSTENNADIFAAFTELAAIENNLGNASQAANWTNRADVAGDFVMSMYDPSQGRFNAGTVPINTPAAPGIDPAPTGPGKEVINQADFLDSDSFTVLALASSQRYQNQIDWRIPVQYLVNTFAETVTSDGETYQGFDIVAQPTTTQNAGITMASPNGIAWEFTGQAVEAMTFVDELYGDNQFADLVTFYQNQIALAQASAPFGNGAGLVAATVQNGGSQPPPLDQGLTTPFQDIPERVGLPATAWAILANDTSNPLSFAPLAMVTGNGQAIAVGGVTPLVANGTDSGNVEMPGTTAIHTFTITNAGSATLTDSTTIDGADPSDFTITKAASASVAVGASTTFTITFDPLHLGTRTATVSIVCNDSAHSIYTFAIQGTGTTDLFDSAFYLQMNPDVAAAVKAGAFTSAYQHFVEYGQYEGRAPDAYFNESFYLTHNPDVAAAVKAGAFTSGFEHFVKYGQQEGRMPDLFFEPAFYLAQNTDVAAAVAAGTYQSGFEHYLLSGQYEGRVFSELFDQTVYLDLYPDVAAAVKAGTFTSGFEHFILYGFSEGRMFEPLFNETYYLAQNPDVAAAVQAGDFTSGFQHFIEYGINEGRKFSPYFNEQTYLADNPDVAAAVEAGDFTSGLEHYVLYGQFEGRTAV